MSSMKAYRALTLAFAGLLAVAAHATITDDLLAVRRARNKSVKTGIWHADLEKAKAYAEANGLPLVAVWSNGDDCSHCLVFEQTAMAPVFRTWMATSGYVFYFGVRNDTYDGQEGYHGTSFYWCRKKDGSSDPNASVNWPYVRLYWKKTNGALKKDEFRTGADLDGEWVPVNMPAPRNCQTVPAKYQVAGDDLTYNPGARYFIYRMTNEFFKAFKPSTPVSYYGGEFGVADGSKVAGARMEVEYGTAVENVYVPLTRTNATAAACVATNYVVAAYPSGKAKTNTVLWAANQAVTNLAVKIAPAWLGDESYQAPSNRIQLVLCNDKKVGVATNYIFCVSPVENSPKNPLWMGEKTAAGLSWGEWTMDMDAATNKVNAARKGGDSQAYTLVLVGGPLWCPDCVSLEDYVINTKEFRAWATETRHIACVAIDEPPFNANLTSPTLLSHAVGGASWCSSVSGSGYLSRKGIHPSDTAKILARNLKCVNADTAHGGLCLPESSETTSHKTSGWKTGVPALVLLRPNGSVAGRIFQFSNDGRSHLDAKSAASIVKRLDELVAQDAEAEEENNDSWLATQYASGAQIGVRGKATATLSFTDAADYYRIDGTAGTDILFSLETADGYGDDPTAILSVIDATVADADKHPVVASTNSLKSGVSVFTTLPSASCYVKVSYPVDDKFYPTQAYFSLTNAGSTLCHYALGSAGILKTSDIMTVTEFTDGDPHVSIYLTQGQVYRFTGLDETAENNLLVLEKEMSAGQWTGRWISKVTTAASLTLREDGGRLVFGYQQWAPGVIGFERAAWSMSEPEEDVDYVVNIRRTGGLSGWAKAKLSLDKGNSTSIDDGSVFEWADEGRVLSWGEGTNDVLTTTIRIKHNELADGDQKVTLKLTKTTDGDATVASDYATFALTIRDDDEPIPGVLSIRAVNGREFPASRRVSAKGGSTLTVVAQRSGGAAGDITGCLSASTGTVYWTQSQTWLSRMADNKQFSFALPAYADVPSHRLTVRLAGVDGATTDPSANSFVVELAPESAPEFVTPGVLNATRFVNAGTYEIAVDWMTVNLFGGDISAAKSGGTLPPGVSWTFDGTYQEHSFNVGRIVLTGTPTAAGTYVASFRATQDGLTGPECTVTINVTDPASLQKDEPEANPYVAESRTFADVFVVDTNASEIVGLVTLTIPPTGRLSARYRKLDGSSVSLQSASWSACESGVYSAVLGQVSDGGLHSMAVVALPNGRVSAVLSDPAFAAPLVCVVPERNWSKANPATTWKGYYTVSMPNESKSALASGDAYVTLRMTTDAAVSAGRVTYAGLLPNGKSFSGSSTLFLTDRVGAAEAALPVFRTSSSDSIAALYSLDMTSDERQKVWAYDGYKPVWRHVGAAEDASYETTFDIFGCLYEQVDLAGCCTNKFGTETLTFFATTTNLPAASGFARNRAATWSTNATSVSVSSAYNADGSFKKSYVVLADAAAAARENGLTFSWNRGTGIVTGKFRFDFADGASVPATYRGIMMPGWGTVDCASCSDNRCDKRPFVSGACWFSDTYAAEDGGQTKETRGVPFSIGVAEGK